MTEPQNDGSSLAEAEAILAEAQTMATAPRVAHEIEIRLPARHNPALQRVVSRVNADLELRTWWRCANINAVDRLGMSDHGPVHVQIIANIALKLLRMLVANSVTPSIVRDYHLTVADAEVIVVLGALLHDVGMAIHRDDHERYSLFLAAPKLRQLLQDIYDEPPLTIVTSEVLHAIISHRSGGRPLTIEAGVVRVSDALDMAKGRSRIPFETGQVNIHSVSAAAINKIEIVTGVAKPIRIAVDMANSAGIYQIDELLKEKLRGSGLEPYVEVVASISGETERKLIEVLEF